MTNTAVAVIKASVNGVWSGLIHGKKLAIRDKILAWKLLNTMNEVKVNKVRTITAGTKYPVILSANS
jgi:hypothetical protein